VKKVTIKTCDKCGASIIKNPAANLKFPKFTIFKFESIIKGGFQSVDLCSNCEDKLNEWLSNKEETERSDNE
jgi:hypothetical protein